MHLPTPQPPAVAALAEFVRDRLNEVADTSRPCSERGGARSCRRRPSSDARGRPPRSRASIVGAAAPFAPTSYSRARLIRQMHASGLLTADEVRRARAGRGSRAGRSATPSGTDPFRRAGADAAARAAGPGAVLAWTSVDRSLSAGAGAHGWRRHHKHLFVTGGVASSLGKGLTASSLGSLLKARGLRVTMQKLDPYLNVDPGTMNPFQHGEVFVTEDGAETDLDIGHYERFLDTDLVGSANVTTGQVYSQRDRQGTARRVPRRHRPGHPAHHQRDQGPHPGDGRPRARTGWRRTS